MSIADLQTHAKNFYIRRVQEISKGEKFGQFCLEGFRRFSYISRALGLLSTSKRKANTSLSTVVVAQLQKQLIILRLT